MNKTTTVIVAVAAILAAVIVTRTPAQNEIGVGACCYGAAGCYVTGTGVVTCLQAGGAWVDGGSCAECPPPPGPTVVSVAMTNRSPQLDGGLQIVRAWSDGQVDAFYVALDIKPGTICAAEFQCDPIILLVGSCPTDINRDGDTGINDFLTLLGGWGACK